MELFVYLSLIVILLNAYFFLLPAMGIKDGTYRLLFLTVLLVICIITRLLFFLVVPAILLGNIVYILTGLFKIPRWLKNVLIVCSVPLMLVLGVFAFGMIFAGDIAFYYYALPLSVFWVYTLWLFIREFPWPQKHKWLSRIFFLLFAVLMPMSIWGYRHNPTTFDRSMTVTINGDTHTYKGKELLKLFKMVQEVIVLEVNSIYEDVDSVQFTSITRSRGLLDDPDFYIHFTVNNKIPFSTTVTFNDGNDIRFSYPESDTDEQLKKRENHDYEEGQLSDLTDKKNQERLKNIDITYYQKDDIYKIKKNN